MKTKPLICEEIISTRVEFNDDGTPYYLHLWIYITGKRTRYSICDSGGNHENATAGDAREFQATAGATLQEYSRFVIRNGEDPLGEFTAKRKLNRKHKVHAVFAPWIGQKTRGMSLESVRIGRRTVTDWRQLPAGLLAYLECEKTGNRQCAEWCKSLNAAVEYVAGEAVRVTGTKGKVRVECLAEWTEPRSPEAIRKEIMRAARKHLARVPV